MGNKKKVFIILGIVLAIVVIGIIVFVRNSKSSNEYRKTIADFSVFEINDIEKSEYVIEKKNDIKVAGKYVARSGLYRLKEKVQFGERAGDMIFLRNKSDKINIFQAKYRIDEKNSISMQVGRYMEEFKQECIEYMGLDLDENSGVAVLSNKDLEDDEIPLEESIYNREKLYSITYEVNKNEEVVENKEYLQYDINFYKSENYLVCEFAKIFE